MHFRAGFVVLAALTGSGCCKSVAGPTGLTDVVNGTVAGRSLSYHDYVPPSGTTQVHVQVRWFSSTDLRWFEVDPGCDAGQLETCRRLTDPIGPISGQSNVIEVIAANQRPENRLRMRFVIENRSDDPASYTLSSSPERAGCT